MLGVAAIAVVAVVLVGWGARVWHFEAQVDETWLRCQREGVLRVGTDATYPPFAVEQGGEFSGYDVDLALEIGRRLGLEVRLTNVAFDGLYDALAAGRVDVLISALPYERERTQDVFYTGGYFNPGHVLVTRRDDERIESFRDLGGCRLAVEMGSVAHQEGLRLRDRERISLVIEAARTGEEAFDLLQAGRVDAALADRVTARLAVRARPELVIVGDPLTDESFVIAVRQDSPQLYAAINGVLDTLRGEGWLDRLAELWL
jgi:polar amino acid transport system substrate-binding protein